MAGGKTRKKSFNIYLKIFQKLESLNHLGNHLIFHVTVFNLEDDISDFGLRTEQKWKWEFHSSYLEGR